MRNARSLWLSFALTLCACAGGASEARPAENPDARLSQTDHSVPAASAAVRQAEAQLAGNDPEGATELLNQALQANPSDARASLDLGIAREMLGNPQGAEAAYRHAIELSPDFAEALNNLGVLLRDRGELSKAVTLLRHAVEANPNSTAAHANLALAFEDQGDLDTAKAEYGKALQIAPNDAMTRANLGLLLLRQGAQEAALQELRRALVDAKGNRAALLAVGNGLRRAGDAASAVQAMQAAVQTIGTPATPALLSELALAQRAAGQREEAIATLQQVLKTDEKYATAHYLLANMLAADQRLVDAKTHYERYLQLEPKGEQAERARERLAVITKMK